MIEWLIDACVSVVVVVDAELAKWYDDDVDQTADVIVSRWSEVSADVNHEKRERVDDILRPVGLETSLLVIRRRANLIALYFLCMTLSTLMSLRHHWRTRQLRDFIVQKLFIFLAGYTRPDGSTRDVLVARLIWPLTAYEQRVELFSSFLGKHKANDMTVSCLRSSVVSKFVISF